MLSMISLDLLNYYFKPNLTLSHDKKHVILRILYLIILIFKNTLFFVR